VLPELSEPFVTTSTLSTWRRSSSAAVSPATPEPTTITSAVVVHPGVGADSLCTKRVMATA